MPIKVYRVSLLLRAKLVRPGEVVLEEVEIPKPKPGEVLIRVNFCGICGSDIHAYHGVHPFIKPPIVLGHEFSGTIEELGEGVKGLEIGQRVVVEPLLTCGKCLNCRLGHYNRCKVMKVIGAQTNGAFSEYLTVPAHRVIGIPNEISFKHGALVEPLAVAVHAVKRAGTIGGLNVVVLGAGTIGLLTACVAKRYGANQVLITDLSDYKLKIAKSLGVDYTVNVRREDPVKIVKDVLDPDGVDVVFECVGSNPVTIAQAIDMVHRGATIIVVGVFRGEIPVKVGLIQDREIELKGTAVYIFKDFLDAIELLRRREIVVDQLISKVFPLKEIKSAFNYIEENRDTVIKVLIRVT